MAHQAALIPNIGISSTWVTKAPYYCIDHYMAAAMHRFISGYGFHRNKDVLDSRNSTRMDVCMCNLNIEEIWITPITRGAMWINLINHVALWRQYIRHASYAIQNGGCMPKLVRHITFVYSTRQSPIVFSEVDIIPLLMKLLN